MVHQFFQYLNDHHVVVRFCATWSFTCSCAADGQQRSWQVLISAILLEWPMEILDAYYTCTCRYARTMTRNQIGVEKGGD